MDYILKDGVLYHHGIKGQKWGERNGPPYPLKRQNKESIIPNKEQWKRGRESTPKLYKPNAILDHVREDGSIKTRTFYDENGKKKKDIHTDNHGKPKSHPFGEKGEHVHDYTWNEDMSHSEKTTRELTNEEKESNKDLWKDKKLKKL